MRKVMTLITTFIKKFFRECKAQKTTRKRIAWVDVPNTCESVKEKEEIIVDTINRLELIIKIIKYE